MLPRASDIRHPPMSAVGSDRNVAANALGDEMRALVYVSPSVLKAGEVAEPVPGEDDVVVSVELVGLGGSEVLALRDPGARALPLIMGHGVVGRTADGRRVA